MRDSHAPRALGYSALAALNMRMTAAAQRVRQIYPHDVDLTLYGNAVYSVYVQLH
jgi:hypothetical protein